MGVITCITNGIVRYEEFCDDLVDRFVNEESLEAASNYAREVIKEVTKPENVVRFITDVAINSLTNGSMSSESDYSDYLPPALNGDPRGAFKPFRD